MSTYNKKFLFFSILVAVAMLIIALILPLLFRIHYLDERTNYQITMNGISGIAFFGLFILITIELVSLFIDKNSSILTLFVAILIFGGYITSRDFVTFISLYHGYVPNAFIERLFNIISNICHSLSCLLILFHIKATNEVEFNKSFIILVLVILAIATGLAFFESGIYVLLTVLMIFFIILSIRVGFLRRLDLYWFFEILIYIQLMSLILLNFLSYYHGDLFYTYNLSSIYAINIIGFFIAVYMNYIIHQNLDLRHKALVEDRLKVLQSSVLKNQISPHFMFNALANIKGTYANDINEGNKSIDYLSSYLRNYLSTSDTYIVPFSKEMEVVENYLAIVNMKFNEPFDIIYDIDVSNFDIVYFGLQPFIENIVKYSRIKEKEDGHIVISTREDETDYIIVISDNGVGFDPNAIGENSYGIINTVERFKLLQNASIKIRSAINEGCEVTIRIPKVK